MVELGHVYWFDTRNFWRSLHGLDAGYLWSALCERVVCTFDWHLFAAAFIAIVLSVLL